MPSPPNPAGAPQQSAQVQFTVLDPATRTALEAKYGPLPPTVSSTSPTLYASAPGAGSRHTPQSQRRSPSRQHSVALNPAAAQQPTFPSSSASPAAPALIHQTRTYTSPGSGSSPSPRASTLTAGHLPKSPLVQPYAHAGPTYAGAHHGQPQTALRNSGMNNPTLPVMNRGSNPPIQGNMSSWPARGKYDHLPLDSRLVLEAADNAILRTGGDPDGRRGRSRTRSRSPKDTSPQYRER